MVGDQKWLGRSSGDGRGIKNGLVFYQGMVGGSEMAWGFSKGWQVESEMAFSFSRKWQGVVEMAWSFRCGR